MAVWSDVVVSLLAAAKASEVEVARSYVSPGPDFARDCRQIVVYGLPQVRPQALGDFAGGGCVLVTQLALRVTFVADCWPVTDGGTLPAPKALTDWTVAWLADCEAIHTALLGWCPPDLDCNGVTFDDPSLGSPTPGGRVAVMHWPVTVALT